MSTQRESVVAWRPSTGEPLGPVIGWQDRRTASWCAELATADADDAGPGPHRPAGRRHVLRAEDPLAARPAAAGRRSDVCVGTVDSWLIWRLTGGDAASDCEAGNASRTLLYDVVDLDWSPELLRPFGVPVGAAGGAAVERGFGHDVRRTRTAGRHPVLAVLADSHAALFGQGCTEVGTARPPTAPARR